METLTAFASAYSVSVTIVFIVVTLVIRSRNKKLKNEINDLNYKITNHVKAIHERNNEVHILQIKLDAAHASIKSLQKSNKELLEKASDDVTVNIKGSDVDIDKVVQQSRKTKKSNGRSTTNNNKVSQKRKGADPLNGPVEN